MEVVKTIKRDIRSQVWFNLLMLLGKFDMYPLIIVAGITYPISPLTDHYKDFYASRRR